MLKRVQYDRFDCILCKHVMLYQTEYKKAIYVKNIYVIIEICTCHNRML